MTKIFQSSVSSLDPLSTQDQGRIVTGDYKRRAPPSSPRSLESSQGHPGLSKHYKIRVVKTVIRILGLDNNTTIRLSVVYQDTQLLLSDITKNMVLGKQRKWNFYEAKTRKGN